MTPASRTPRSLDVEGGFTIETPRGALVVEGRGAQVRLSAPSWRALLALRRAQPLRTTVRRRMLAAVDAALRSTGLTLDIVWRGRSVARTGAGTRESFLAHLFGWPAVQLVPLVRVDARPPDRASRR